MLRSLLALFIIAVFTSYAVRSVYAAMLMYWWFGIFRPQDWMWWDVSSLRLPLLAAILFITTALAKGYYPRSTHPVWMLTVIFLGAVLSASIFGCTSYQPVTTTFVLILIAITLVTERTLESNKAIWGLLLVTTASLAYHNSSEAFSAVLGGYTLYNLPIGSGAFSGGNAAAMGAAISVFLQLFVVGAIDTGKTGNTPDFLSKPLFRLAAKGVLYVLVAGSLLLIYKTESRGAALSLLLGVAVWMLLQPRKFRTLFAVASLASVVLLIGIPDDYVDRLDSAFVETEELDGSAKSRPHFWNTAKQMAEENLLGVGVGCFKQNYNSYDASEGFYGRNRSVHSSHYSILAETGYPGFSVWLLLLLTTFLTLFRARSRAKAKRASDAQQDFYFRLSNSIIASMAVFVAGGSFYEIAYNDFTWLMFAITVAMARLQVGAERRVIDSPVEPAR